MMKIIAALLVASASAFAPTKNVARTTQVSETKADLEAMGPKLNPVVKYWDPLNLVSSSPWGFTEEQTIGWLRHSEIKHGRVAMAAFVGYIVQSNFVLPWPLTLDGTPHPSTALSPPEQWDALPYASKLQIVGFVGFLEFFSELNIDGSNPHYTKGGKPGYFPPLKGNVPHNVPFNLYDPFNRNKKMTDAQKEVGLLREINNGRLAQLGIFGFLCEQTIPGSVPGLSGIVPSYAGEVMAPFEGNL